jgi:hypothetical protein
MLLGVNDATPAQRAAQRGESNMTQRCEREKKHGRNVIVAAGLIIGLAATAGMVASCGGHGMHHGKDPEKVRKYVLWKVDDHLDDLDATAEQKREILQIAERVLADGVRLHEGKGAHHEALLAELESGGPDSAVLHGMLDEHLEQFRGFGHRTIDALLEAWNLLDENQRGDLIDEFKEHIEDHG